MKVHARLAPGLVEPGEAIQIRLHLPRKLGGVSLKLWELDAFIGRHEVLKRDPDGDVLIAQWDGVIEHGEGKTPNDLDYCKFTPSKATISSNDADCFGVRVVLPGGADPVVIPIGSERTELTPRFVQLALSVEQGGAELFRTKSTCVARMPATTVKITHHVFLGRTEDRLFDEDGDDDSDEEAKRDVTLAHKWVTFGLSKGDGMQARLEVVGSGWVGGDGVVLDSDDVKGQPLFVRSGRKLFAYVHDAKLDLPKGVSKIPISACDTVDESGQVTGERPELADQLEVRIAEVAATGGAKPRFTTDLASLPTSAVPDADDHLRAMAEAAKRFQKEANADG